VNYLTLDKISSAMWKGRCKTLARHNCAALLNLVFDHVKPTDRSEEDPHILIFFSQLARPMLKGKHLPLFSV
jgi:hypothetical protein